MHPANFQEVVPRRTKAKKGRPPAFREEAGPFFGSQPPQPTPGEELEPELVLLAGVWLWVWVVVVPVFCTAVALPPGGATIRKATKATKIRKDTATCIVSRTEPHLRWAVCLSPLDLS